MTPVAFAVAVLMGAWFAVGLGVIARRRAWGVAGASLVRSALVLATQAVRAWRWRREPADRS